MSRILKVLSALLFFTTLLAAPAFAQSTASPVVPGYWTTIPQPNCTGTQCFVQYGPTGGSGSTASVEGNTAGTGSIQTIFAGSPTATRHVLLQVQGADVWACSFKSTTPSISGNVGFQLKNGTSNVTGDGGSYSTPSGANDNGPLTCITTGASDHLYWSYQ